jgi:hypothetical protein
MHRSAVLTLSEAIAAATFQGASWQIMVGNRIDDISLRISLTTNDRSAEVCLKINNGRAVILDGPDRSGPDTSDFYHVSATFRSTYALSISVGAHAATVPILEAASTYNRFLGAWSELDAMLHDPVACSEACVSATAFHECLTSVGLTMPSRLSSVALNG